MPAIKIQARSKYSAPETFQRVKDLLADDPGLRKIDAGYTCTFDEASHRGEVQGKQFSAKIGVVPNSTGADVEIDVDLAFLLSPFKGQVKSTLERKLESALA